MHPIVFIEGTLPAEAVYQGSYTPGLVLLSLLIAALGAFSGFSHIDLMRATHSRRTRLIWHVSGAAALGLAVWSMHFIGMVAFELPVDIQYLVWPTIASMAPAMVAGFVILRILSRSNPPLAAVLIGGVIMGAGIGVMHYLGMSAMITPAVMAYKPSLFILSLVVAVVVATLALITPAVLGTRMGEVEQRQPLAFKILSSLLLGTAIASMHYVAMGATRFIDAAFYPHGVHQAVGGWTATPNLIAGLAATGSLMLLVTATFSAILRTRITLSKLEIRRLETRQQLLDDRFNKIVSRLPGMVYQFRVDANGKMSFPFASAAIKSIYGVTPEQVAEDATVLTDIFHPDDLAGIFSSIEESAQALTPWQHEYRVLHDDDSVKWLQGNATPEREEDGSVLWNGFITDITQRRTSEEIIHRLAHFDELTGLPNRRLLQDRLDQAMQTTDRQASHGALLFLDLDDFKSLNDTQGHSQGDALLIHIASSLNDKLRSADTVARLGGDEFVVVLDHLDPDPNRAAEEALSTAEEVHRLLNEPVDLDQYRYQPGVSIGICLFSGHEVSREELLRRSDIAMYQSKSAGRNTIRFFDPEIQEAMAERFKMESELRVAIQENQLRLYFQPQVDQHRQVTGAEALLRWEHPERGIISPGEFIPLAEQSGLILPIGHWVLEQAVHLLVDWQKDSLRSQLVLSVNVSARQFHQPDFVDQVADLLSSSRVAPQRLKLELTESLILADLNDTREKMEYLSNLGVHLSMDDFGTGYSSMAYLSQLQFDEVKIDQSFVRNLSNPETSGQKDWVIVDAIIGITRGLDMDVIAEGVETAAQESYLLAKHCQRFQGYLYARPMPIKAFNEYLESPDSTTDQ